MTPFELSLRQSLEEERVRMSNSWFFKWHNINIPNHVVDVEDFYGGRFHVGGIVFEGQVQMLYWRSVGKYLLDRVHKIFADWSAACASYPLEKQILSLETTAAAARTFVSQTIQTGKSTDKALRGRGFPDSVQEYYASGPHVEANAEIERMKDAHLALLVVPTTETLKSLPKRIEEFLVTWKGMCTAFGLLIAAVSFIARFLI